MAALLQSLRQAARLQAGHGAVSSLQQLRCLAAPANQLQLIKKLREQTGAPMGDVKTALQAAGWDLGELQGRRMRRINTTERIRKVQMNADRTPIAPCQVPPAAAAAACCRRSCLQAARQPLLAPSCYHAS